MTMAAATDVTSVRVERLQDISEEDALAEGVPTTTGEANSLGFGEIYEAWFNLTPRGRFAKLWEHINGKRAPWSMNLWVYAVTFKVAS